MRILINLATLKAGGGQNVGLNFIESMANLPCKHTIYYVVAKKSIVAKKVLEVNKNNCIVCSRNPILRIIDEYWRISHYIKKNNIDCVYSYFGYGFYKKNIKQVCGVANSNLFYPEIDFWDQYKGLKKIFKKIIDSYRLYGYKHANGLIFENAAMLDRSKDIIKRKDILCTYIKPSICINYSNKEIILDKNIMNAEKKCLFLCGWQLNKNIMIIPKLARYFKDRGHIFHFILTAPICNNKICKNFMKMIKNYDVVNEVSMIGIVEKEKLTDLYNKIDYVFLLSKLESFSNNIIEAWYFKKQLVISDEEWAHSICKNTAMYVKRNDVKDIYNKIINNDKQQQEKEERLQNGIKEFMLYPTINEKTNLEITFIERVVYKQ